MYYSQTLIFHSSFLFIIGYYKALQLESLGGGISVVLRQWALGAQIPYVYSKALDLSKIENVLVHRFYDYYF